MRYSPVLNAVLGGLGQSAALTGSIGKMERRKHNLWILVVLLHWRKPQMDICGRGPRLDCFDAGQIEAEIRAIRTRCACEYGMMARESMPRFSIRACVPDTGGCPESANARSELDRAWSFGAKPEREPKCS
jgi:hypothetical protein